MIKENEAEFKKSNLLTWHNAEYKGQGITIVVLDDRGIPAKHLNVETPFLEEHRDDKDNHNTQVCSVARESAPQSRIISMPWFGGIKKEIIDWIFEHKDEIDIINCSFTGVVGKDEFNRLKQLDIPIVCASGNNANEDKISRPARYDWTIAIGAVTESNGHVTGYSNRGKELDAVSYTNIYIASYSYGYDKVFSFGGTSCASPYACGMLACYLSWRKEKGLPRLNKEEIRQFIHDNSIDMYEEGHDYKSGYGLFALPKEIPEVENNPSPSPVPETPIIEENSIDLKDIMSESDYSKYINFRNIYENATKDGNEVASKYAKDSMIELLNQYKLDSEDYIDDEVTPRPKPEEPIEEPEPPIEEPEPPIIEEPPKEEPPTEPIKPKDILVAISDGHGMETAGKRTPILPNGTVMKENEFNSAVKKYLDANLKRCGFRTLIVAEGDADIPLKQRTDLANDKKADIYVSVHANAFDGKFDDYDPSGVETYHYPNSIEGKKLAEIIHKHLIQGTKQVNRGVKTANFHELRETNMPAVLIEAGFMDNLEEAKLLLSDSFRKEVAKEIALGICEYYDIPYIDETVEPIAPTQMPIISSPTATIEQMKEWAKSKKANQLLIDLAPIFYDVSVSVGINPVVTYCQSAKETGYMNFGGVLDATYHNPCGLKNTSGGGDYDPNAHKRFANWEEGITAMVDHLALYSGVEGYPKANTPDPRHFPYLHGTATTVESLGGKWAPSTEYGNSIVRMVKEVENTVVEVEPEPTPKPIEQIELTDIKIKLHDKDLTVKGIYNDGINYIPVRFLEQLGYDISWNNGVIEIDYKI